jgi:hypothetical protein
MVKKLTALFFGILLIAVAGQASAGGFSISIGTDNFYLSVGNYDYYQYALPYYRQTPRISFYDVMSDYGTWVWVQPFGQVWRPYVTVGWRPYVYGHWTYTRYGPTWVGYEPWAWVGYHYGNWIWSGRNGWVWIPGYDWHPGRVIWSHGYDAVGWMPAPPPGYDYSRGYLDYRGSYNQFDYYDNDFEDYNGYYGDPYANRGYQDLYYRPEYRNIAINLWVFIDINHYNSPNYGDYYLDSDYTRTLFDRRLVRISSRPVDRPAMERIVRQKIREVDVNVREVDATKQRIKVITPVTEEDNVRANANRVVNNVIAPAFAEKQRDFKGLRSQNTTEINKVFRQENKQPRIRKVEANEMIHQAEVQRQQVEVKRKNLVREKTETVIRVDKDADKRKKENRDAQDQFNQKPGDRSRDQIQPSDRNQNTRQDQLDQKQHDQRDNKDRFPDQNKQQQNRNDQFEHNPKDQKNDVNRVPDQSRQKDQQKQNRDNQFNNNPKDQKNDVNRVPDQSRQKDQQKQNRDDQNEKNRKPTNQPEDTDRVQPSDRNNRQQGPNSDLNRNPNQDQDNVAPNQKKQGDQGQVSKDQDSKDQPQTQDDKSDKKNKQNTSNKKQKDNSKKDKKPNQDDEPNR